jgi:hypothetical protein
MYVLKLQRNLLTTSDYVNINFFTLILGMDLNNLIIVLVLVTTLTKTYVFKNAQMHTIHFCLSMF